jgi:chromosomal replication initiation ATPase DnaA
MNRQLLLRLELDNPLSQLFFVPHSGVSEAMSVFERSVEDLLGEDPRCFRLIFLYGAKGTGKSHLISAYREKLEQAGYGKVSTFSLEKLCDAQSVRAFIDRVETGRIEGGFVIVEGESLPADQDDLTPHVRSRLLSGYAVRIGYPSEEELKPLLLSILERKNLRLPDHSLKALLRILPANPLSMERIVAAVDELALTERKKVNRGVIAEALRQQ